MDQTWQRNGSRISRVLTKHMYNTLFSMFMV